MDTHVWKIMVNGQEVPNLYDEDGNIVTDYMAAYAYENGDEIREILDGDVIELKRQRSDKNKTQ